MSNSHLTLRLNGQDAQLIEALRAHTGMSKSDLVKSALRALASHENLAGPAAESLFSLGEKSFGRHGDVTRQSNNVKAVVRSRLDAKRRS